MVKDLIRIVGRAMWDWVARLRQWLPDWCVIVLQGLSGVAALCLFTFFLMLTFAAVIGSAAIAFEIILWVKEWLW